MAILKAGTRLKSAVCSTEIMVVAAPKDEVELTCGGAAVIELGADAPEASPSFTCWFRGTWMNNFCERHRDGAYFARADEVSRKNHNRNR